MNAYHAQSAVPVTTDMLQALSTIIPTLLLPPATAAGHGRADCKCPDCACRNALPNTALYGQCGSCGTWRAVKLDGTITFHAACPGIKWDGTAFTRPPITRIAALCSLCRDERHYQRGRSKTRKGAASG